ncbi:MAG: polyprenyl synthetase family protein [Deltaproteobacteria bacterium]|nr:polyprenyl synthetase family protein [Deltaproteobacteria bacterium]MBW2447983.1 polyprenyl synthetase family protein [Deltaproteobacteria bacterium]
MSPSSSDLSAPIAEALERVEPRLEQVERAMNDQLASQSEAVALVGDHVLSSGGKRIRPALLFFAAEMCGYDGPRQVQIAASVELLHTATLLHDDVVDLSELRRGRPAAHAVYGNRRAVLVGDYLYARASLMIIEDGDSEIQLLFSDTIRRMAEGELLQLARGFDPEMTETVYFDVIERKSAALLSAAAEAGAILAAVTRAERRRLSEFGRQIGLAFQLRDDALDYSGGEEELGKRPYDDLREGKVTLPLLLTLKRATPAERDEVASVLKALSRAAAHGDAVPQDRDRALDEVDVAPALALVERYRGVEDTVRRAQELARGAVTNIEPFPDGPGKRALVAAADYAVGREN